MIDPPTLIAYSVVLFALIGALFIALWIKEGRSARLLWWSLPFLMGACAGALLVNPRILPGLWAGRLAVWFILLAYGFGWQAARIANDRRPLPLWVVLPATVWLLLSAIVFESWQLFWVSGVMRTLIIGTFNALAAHDFSRTRSDDLPSRPVLFWIFAVYAVLSFARAPFAAWLPGPLGAAPGAVWATVVYNLAVVTQALLVGALIIARSHERIAQQHYRLAVLDPLTGVFNRRAFDRRVEETTGKSAAPVSLLVVDIDHFKTINDRFGHGFGDRVIVLAARTAESVLRRQDAVYRIGGEEFVCLLPDTAAEDAVLVAERLRRAFEADALQVDGRQLDGTLSIGIATAPPGSADLRALLAEADAALYLAKRAGRNRSMANTSPASTP